MSDLTPAERERIAPYVTDTQAPVFALRNLPQATAAALFARYSRSPKSLRRILLDEFLDAGVAVEEPTAGAEAASALLGRVIGEFSDDSVGQLGSAHLAVEGASNVLTKVIEWGRLASYLEQSTRYIAFTDRPGGRYRYHRPEEVLAHPRFSSSYLETMDGAFATYGTLLPRLEDHFGQLVPTDPAVPPAARARAVKARALDELRGLLPAATTSNLGVFASGQAFEALLHRLAAHPLPEARRTGEAALVHLRQVIPDFLTRVDRPDRGVLSAAYLWQTRSATAEVAARLLASTPAEQSEPTVRLLEWDPEAETRVIAHALWPHTELGLAEVLEQVGTMSEGQRAEAMAAFVGERLDRRHKPGRALEAADYTFEVVCDYGAYRDLQRHRLLSLQAQTLTPRLGYAVPEQVEAAGAGAAYRHAQERCRELHAELEDAGFRAEAPYAVTMAHRIRFVMKLNARAALHLIELRSQPQGHDSYRAVAVAMREAIRDVAGHHLLAGLMSFTDHSRVTAGRLRAEVASERRAARDHLRPGQ